MITMVSSPRIPGFKLASVLLSLCLGGLLVLTLGGNRVEAQASPLAMGWKSFGIEGDIAYAPVRLDGYPLFSIATDLSQSDSNRSGIGALQMRRSRIENLLHNQLQTLLEQGIDPDDLQIVVTQLNKQTAVQAVVAGNPGRPMVTITALDAEIYGLTEADLADEVAQNIQTGLERGMAERQPAAQWRQAKQGAVGAAIAALLIALLAQINRWVGRSQHPLKHQLLVQQESLAQQQAALSPDEPLPEPITDLQHQIVRLKRRIERKTWLQRILQLSMVTLGLWGTAWVLQRFPQTRSLGLLLIRQPLGLLLLGLMLTLLIILSRLGIDRAVTQWVGTADTIPAVQLARRQQRGTTLAMAWKDVVTLFWIVVGGVMALNLVTLSAGFTLSLQLGALGLLASLVFQSTIQDALSGVLLLARDAYTIGDTVAIQDITGVVETMGLAMTQIRNSPGHLITLRNGQITSVANYSRDWARMDYAVLVDHDTDIRQALTVMAEVLQTLQASSDWADKLIDQPDILGVSQIDPQGILLQIRTQTAPGQQFSVLREYRLRLNQAFNAKGIRLALPQRELRYRDPDPRPSDHPSE